MKYKILAVDDNPINLKLLSRALINSNYQIFTADNGKKALVLAGQERPDLILLDVILPDLDGYEVCKQLQENEATKHIPVIFLSAKNESVDKARGLAVGAVDYLTKPFDPLEINARVRTHLSIRKNNIKLLQQNQKLQAQLHQLTQKYAKVTSNIATTDFLNKINRSNIHIIQSKLEFLAMSKSAVLPQTIKLIPIEKNSGHFFFLLLNGFKKDYATVIVQLLFENYISGFLTALNWEQTDHAEVLRGIREAMDQFSPDIYQVAFTFALGFVKLQAYEWTYFSFQEEWPLIISATGEKIAAQERRGNSYSAVGDLLQVSTFAMKPNETLCFYRTSEQTANPADYDALFLKAFNDKDLNLQRGLLMMDEKLAKDDYDQLVAGMALK